LSDELVHLPVPKQPVRISPLGPFGDLLEEFDCLGLVAGLTRILGRDNHFDSDGDHIATFLNKPPPLHPFAFDAHGSTFNKEMNRDQFRHLSFLETRPDRLALTTIGQQLADLDRRIRFGSGAFGQ
jgi:hypothetical protein